MNRILFHMLSKAVVLATVFCISALPWGGIRAGRRDGGFVPLFPENGVPKGWLVRRWDDVRKTPAARVVWTVKDGVLHGGEPRGSWLISEKTAS